MAAPQSFRIKIEKCDRGTLSNSSTVLKLGTTRNENMPIETVVPMTTAQFQGLCNYLANMRGGVNTGAIETAITGVGI